MKWARIFLTLWAKIHVVAHVSHPQRYDLLGGRGYRKNKFKEIIKKSDQQEEVRIFNVDFRALTGVSGNKYVPIADTDCRQNMLKRSIKFFRNLYRMKRQEHIRPNRPTGDGKIKSFFSNLNLMGDNNRSGQGRS
ncbi:uncharacterized protein LOC132642329 isoform X2 [Lycium barbarum]|uniref:uncharacterized protein LOC132642329 isoform X2 n=1 Tax=Lycium barbarum TaxID=112863 RepID=UPI00293F209D|nr:uncharacterized protein LOC132642329 isoform X2 [Lycium barbarum]